jgi:hypothetical protein
VGRMTCGAFIGNIRMLPGKGADELAVAVKAKPFLVHRHKTSWSLAPMGFMAVCAQHPAFRNRVPGSEGEFRSDGVMATHALPVDLGTFELLLTAQVQLVAVRTADLTQGVVAEGPVLHVGHGVRAVALETEHGKGCGGQPFKGDELGCIALTVLVDKVRLDGFAARAMTGLTVDEGHIRPLDLLLPVDTSGEEFSCLIVLVAGLETCLVSHVVRKKGPDEYLLVFPHGNHGTAGFHGRTGYYRSCCSKNDQGRANPERSTENLLPHIVLTPFSRCAVLPDTPALK